MVKPHMLVLSAAIAEFMGFSVENSMSIAFGSMIGSMIGFLFASYPFALAERDKLNALYAKEICKCSLPIKHLFKRSAAKSEKKLIRLSLPFDRIIVEIDAFSILQFTINASINHMKIQKLFFSRFLRILASSE